MTCERFNWISWEHIESLREPKISPGSVIHAGKIYIAGKCSKVIEIYDPETETFLPVLNFFLDKMSYKVPLILSNKLFII